MTKKYLLYSKNYFSVTTLLLLRQDICAFEMLQEKEPQKISKCEFEFWNDLNPMFFKNTPKNEFMYLDWKKPQNAPGSTDADIILG